MASSSSAKKYDVFISFRGEDTRFNFTSHLYEALRRNQIDAYIDYRLEKGDKVWPSLEKAIQDSTLFLVIFSENYASSTWTLKELSKILDCSKNQSHQLVMPVFYRVDPSHVRKQSGSYQKAFEEHERKSINKHQLQNWREALTHAANLSGWHCSFDRNEAEQIKEIVKCVTQKLGCKYQSENDLKELIGIQKRIGDVELLLDKVSNNNVQLIGIWGMGGMGKTTLAKALFNKLHFAYEGFCFLANVREKSKKYGIAALKKNLILKILGDKKSHIGMLDEISPYAMCRLSRKKVFLVLDDVDDHEQLENLVGRDDWFGSGSKILITTRDKQILGKRVDYVYTHEALNFNEAFQLFSLNAFKKECGDPKVRRLAMDVIHYADGNPLALKVLGSFLYGKNHEAWRSQLEKLRKLPYPKINDILKWSFEGLDCEEKKIFLDIACFFNGNYVEKVKNLLDACGYSTIIGLKNLEDKALLHINEGRIFMHQLIKEMGRQIVREESLNDPQRRSRLWNSNEIFEILKNNMGSEAIEGIALNLSEVEEICLSPQAFCSMPNLKFLTFDEYGNHQDGNKLRFPCGIEFLPSKLRLLRWMEYPLNSLPATFKVENLVNLEMPNSNLTKLWDGVQNLVNLSRIQLVGSKSLLELPNFSKAQHLSEVNLNRCSKLGSVHPSILSLHSLRYLWLGDCKALTSLTSNTHLKSLSELDLGGCSKLNKFSVTSENYWFELKLSGTAVNEELCSSSGRLSKIDSLFLDECKRLTNLPYKLADLSNLRRLYIRGCNKLASNLRALFDRIRTLEVLRLDNCSELFEVPDNISLLSSLRELDLSRTKIETLPLSIKYLSSLQDLCLDGCERLRSLPELPSSIVALSTQNCLSLEILHLPLMSEYGQGKEVYDDDDDEVQPYPYFMLTNCMKLDRQSIKAVEARVLLEINKAIFYEAIMEYPGNRVPEWFMYKTTQYFVTVDLSSIPQPWDGNFIFCAVVSQASPSTYIDATWFIDGEYAWMAQSSFDTDELNLSDHVVLWYDSHSFGGVQRKIDEKKKHSQNNTYHPLLEIEFTVRCWKRLYHGSPGEIKECGVCPTSAVGYQNYIKQVKLALHGHPNSNAMGLGCSFYKEVVSRKRKYQSWDEFEEMTLSFKALKLNDLPTSTCYIHDSHKKVYSSFCS